MRTIPPEHQLFVEVYTNYFETVFVTARALCKDNDEAEEIAQKVFVNLWDYRHRIPEVQNMANYLKSSTRNEFLNPKSFKRRFAFCSTNIDGDAIKSEDMEEGKEVTTPEQMRVPSYDEEFSGELDNIFHRFLLSLKPKWRRVFVLRVCHCLSGQEISDRVGFGPTSVANMINVTRQWAKVFMGEYAYGVKIKVTKNIRYAIK